MPRKRIASALRVRKSIRKGDDASDATLIPVYTSKRKPPRAFALLPPGPPNVILPLAYRAPMSAIGRSVGIEANLVSVRLSFHLRLLRGCQSLSPPAVCSPKRQNPSGKQTPLLPPAQSPRLHTHSNTKRDGSLLLLCHHDIPRRQTPSALVLVGNVRGPPPLRKTCTTTC